MPEWIHDIWANDYARSGLVFVSSFLVAWIVQALVISTAARLVARTKTDIDDVLLGIFKSPIYFSIILMGSNWALRLLHPTEGMLRVGRATLFTLAIALWSVALLRASSSGLKAFAQRGKGVLQPRTLPLFDILAKTGILGGAIYLAMVAWNIDIGAWLASAGVVGIAIGFAARDSLANYFAGIFIIADAPYKLEDVITLDDGTRGRVTDIGLRSTRIHTNDGIEINIPNSILGNMRIENRSAGPATMERTAVAVGVAYGSDIVKVMEVLVECAKGAPGVVESREPKAYFVGFGDSSLDFLLKAWVADPAMLESARHELHIRIHDALVAADVEIPFPQRDVHMKQA